MASHQVRLLTENLDDQSVLMAIFLAERQRGSVEVRSYLVPSEVVGGAQISLSQHPDRPVALILNGGSRSAEALDEDKAVIRRLLGDLAPDDMWNLTYAVPSVDAWVMADPRIKAAFDADEATRRSRYERSLRIGELAQQAPIDRDAIAQAFPEFRALLRFIEQHAPAPQAVT